MNYLLHIPLLLLFSFSLSAQGTAEDTWKNALKKFRAKEFKEAIVLFEEYNQVRGTSAQVQSYIGDCYYNLLKGGKAAGYYEDALSRTKAPNKVKYCRLQIVRSYLQQQNFEKAYEVAFENVQLYPEAEDFRQELQDVCLWAHLTTNQNLATNYLTDFRLQHTYIVNSTASQKLIARNLRSETGERYIFSSRKNVGYAQRWHGYFADQEEESKDLLFLFTDTEFEEALEEQEARAMQVFENEELPIYERLGAFYFLAPLDNNKLKTMLQYDDLDIRACICGEVRAYIAPKYKKVCEKDEREAVQKMVTVNPAFVK